MGRENKNHPTFIIIVVAAIIVIGFVVGSIGIDMFYEKTTATIGNVSFSAGLVLIIIGLILIIVALSQLSKTNRGQIPVRPWLARNWLILLGILIGIVLLAAFIGTHYKFPTEDKYKILVDLILIIFGLSAAVGYGIFRWISHNIEDRAKTITKQSHNYTMVGVEVSEGYVWWKLYKAEAKRQKEIKKLREKIEGMQKHLLKNERKHNEKEEKTNRDDYIDYLESAIKLTKRALDRANQLGEKEYEKLICDCKNNLAYYLAERYKEGRAKMGDKELARSCVDYVYKRIAKYPHDKEEWADTCQFVWQQFPNSKG